MREKVEFYLFLKDLDLILWLRIFIPNSSVDNLPTVIRENNEHFQSFHMMGRILYAKRQGYGSQDEWPVQRPPTEVGFLKVQ